MSHELFDSSVNPNIGTLCLSTDYLRGRMMKTDVTIRPDGRIDLITRNRGEAASRWVMRLQGKRILQALKDPVPESSDE